jgi:hypothetical protein
MFTTKEVVTAILNYEHSFAVADQFRFTFSGEQQFHEQDLSALKYIAGILQELIEDSDVLSDSAVDDLQSYLDELGIYLAKNS